MLRDTDIRKIREAAEKATPGPWKTYTVNHHGKKGTFVEGKTQTSTGVCTSWDHGQLGVPVAIVEHHSGPFGSYAHVRPRNAEFIAMMNPEVAKEMAIEIKRLRLIGAVWRSSKERSGCNKCGFPYSYKACSTSHALIYRFMRILE